MPWIYNSHNQSGNRWTLMQSEIEIYALINLIPLNWYISYLEWKINSSILHIWYTMNRNHKVYTNLDSNPNKHKRILKWINVSYSFSIHVYVTDAVNVKMFVTFKGIRNKIFMYWMNWDCHYNPFTSS